MPIQSYNSCFLEFLEVTMGGNLCDLGLGKDFLDMTSKMLHKKIN